MGVNLQVDRAINQTAQLVKDQSGNTTSLTVSTSGIGMGTTTPDARLTLQSASGDVLTTKDHVGTTRFALHSNHAKPFFHELNSHNYDLRLSSFAAGGSGGNIELHTGIDSVVSRACAESYERDGLMQLARSS